MPNYDYRCPECETVKTEYRKYEDRDRPIPCVMCKDSEMVRTWLKMPGTTKASFIDSRKTKRAADMHDLKEAAKLEVEAANLPHDKRTEIKKEIRERKKVR